MAGEQPGVVTRAKRAIVAVVVIALGGALAAPHLTAWMQSQTLLRHERQLQETGARLDAQQQELVEHEDALARHEKVLAEHQRELEAHEGVLESHGRELERLGTNLQRAEGELKSAREAAGQDRERVQRLEQEVKALRQQLDELQQAQQRARLQQEALLKDILRRLGVLEDNRGRPPVE